MSVRVSIALCTYNGGKHLRQQLDSYLAQTRRPDDLVVSDDRSTDDTHDVIRRFAAEAPFPVRLHVNPTNLGVHQNFANAIALADGDVILMSDQDDVWKPHKIATLLAAFDAPTRPGLVFSDAEVVDADLRPLHTTHWRATGFPASVRRRASAGDAFGAFLVYNSAAGATTAFLARWRRVLLPIPPGWAYDNWVSLLLAAFTPCALIDEPLNLYRQHGSQSVGLNAFTLANRAATTPAANRAHAVEVAAAYQAMLDRIRAHAGELLHPSYLPLMEAKVAFLRLRAALPPNRLRRAPVVAGALLRGRYHRFASGFKSFAKDLLR